MYTQSSVRMILVGCLARYQCKFFFFFFQAEDGIRDRNVTGVQTCALPICNGKNVNQGGWCEPGSPSATNPQQTRNWGPRSEERRVGKECRSRWWPDH